MLQTRVIPCLLLRDRGLVKGVRFRKHQYVGDPVNAIRIFNDKEVDEIAIIDIGATLERRPPDFALIRDIASECFIPFSYGGGITNEKEAATLFSLGVERVIINTSAYTKPELIRSISSTYGSQSVIISVDVKKNFFGKYVLHSNSGAISEKNDLLEFSKKMEDLGAGEILLGSIDKEGTGEGFDLELLSLLARQLSIPVIISGGAGKLEHIRQAIDAGASAVAVGSMFVFYGKHRAVLINYPSPSEIKELLKGNK